MGRAELGEPFDAWQELAVLTDLVGSVESREALRVPRDERRLDAPKCRRHHLRFGGVGRVRAPVLRQWAAEGLLQPCRVGEQQQALLKALGVPDNIEKAQERIEPAAGLRAGLRTHVLGEGIRRAARLELQGAWGVQHSEKRRRVPFGEYLERDSPPRVVPRRDELVDGVAKQRHEHDAACAAARELAHQLVAQVRRGQHTAAARHAAVEVHPRCHLVRPKVQGCGEAQLVHEVARVRIPSLARQTDQCVRDHEYIGRVPHRRAPANRQNGYLDRRGRTVIRLAWVCVCVCVFERPFSTLTARHGSFAGASHPVATGVARDAGNARRFLPWLFVPTRSGTLCKARERYGNHVTGEVSATANAMRALMSCRDERMGSVCVQPQLER